MDLDPDLDLDLTGRWRDDPVPGYALRLRSTVRICSFQLGTVALLALLCWAMTRQGRVIAGLPGTVPLALSVFSAMLILLSSRLRSASVRRAIPPSSVLPVSPDAVLAAYKRATIQSFAILELAALLGLGVAVTSGFAAYGLIHSIASSLSMLTRWPRAAEVDRLVRGRATP